VCFYSIGNFLTTGQQDASKTSHAEWNLFWYERTPGARYGFPDHCRQIVLPKLTITTEGISRVGMIPAYINDQAQPAAVRPGDPLFDEVLNRLEWVSAESEHRFEVVGDELEVVTLSPTGRPGRSAAGGLRWRGRERRTHRRRTGGRGRRGPFRGRAQR
jgi:poly-gamma-glutamate synthesis protein (capsule biosynthesis protein)